MRRAAVVLVAALALGTMAGCRTEPSSSGASGTVVDRDKVRNYGKSVRRYHYTVTVKEDGGKRDTGRVSRDVYDRCQVGDRWPECKR